MACLTSRKCSTNPASLLDPLTGIPSPPMGRGRGVWHHVVRPPFDVEPRKQWILNQTVRASLEIVWFWKVGRGPRVFIYFSRSHLSLTKQRPDRIGSRQHSGCPTSRYYVPSRFSDLGNCISIGRIPQETAYGPNLLLPFGGNYWGRYPSIDLMQIGNSVSPPILRSYPVRRATRHCITAFITSADTSHRWLRPHAWSPAILCLCNHASSLH